jgi:hypothetical protein
MVPSANTIFYRTESFGVPGGHARVEGGRVFSDRPCEERAAAVGVHRPLRPNFKMAVSVHEAGHAAADLVLGLPLAGASIDEVDGYIGRV